MRFYVDMIEDCPKGFPPEALPELFDLDLSNNNDNPSSSPKTVGQDSSDPETRINQTVLSYCSTILSITDCLSSYCHYFLKKEELTLLLHTLKSLKHSLPDEVLSALVAMMSVNLFRPLPPPNNNAITGDLLDNKKHDSTLSPTWPHLRLVYIILLRPILDMDPNILRKYIDQSFLTNILCLFQSDDPRERKILKNIYQKIYSRFNFHREFMRKSMSEVLLHHIFETETHYGISELLEVWGSIVQDFIVPLEEEHKLFLSRVLIPLHKTRGVMHYHSQLSYCVNQLVQKEPMLGDIVVRGLLKYWPITNCKKEVLLIGELEQLVENVDPDHYRTFALPLCTKITRCLNSWHSQVAERALQLWKKEVFVKLANSAIEEVFPVVVEGLEKNLKGHWSQSVKGLTKNVKAMLKEKDPSLYEKCLQEISHKEYLAKQEELKRKERWERIELEAAKNRSN